jgi:catechol 2,3-dioxygenase-like lactoylglutathione lyase family enzyme
MTMTARIKASLKATYLLLILLIAPLAHAQTAPKSPPIHGIAHIAIRVHDIAVSRAFYEKLGYQQAFAFHKDNANEASPISQSFIKINDRQFIELYPTSPTPDNQPAHGFMHLCFDGDDLNALHDFDVAQGLTPIAVRKASAGNLLFTLRGPEDQNIEYTQYMPGSLHYEDRGKHISTSRIAEGFFAVGLSMKDENAAHAFYTTKLDFNTVGLNPHLLYIPGSEDKIHLESLTTTASRIYLTVPDLKKTAVRLKTRGIAYKLGKNQLTITDPDGNFMVFTDGVRKLWPVVPFTRGIVSKSDMARAKVH